MPKKRSIAKGHSKALQRLHERAVHGPALPEPEEPREAPAPATAASDPIPTPTDTDRLRAAQAKRQRRAARNLVRT